MHFSAKRGIAIACRLSVCLSVTLVDCDHIGWNSSKIISPLVSLGCSLFAEEDSRYAIRGIINFVLWLRFLILSGKVPWYVL